MTKTIINPPSLPKPSGFSHAILTEGGRTVFLAGQPGLDVHGKVVSPGDLVAQFEQALANIKTIIETAGGAMQDIVKITFYVMDKDDYKAQLKPIGKVYRAYFEGYYPATTLVEVSGLFDDGALIEIDCFAVLRS
jgi:enamine deaminase RidA (YjgF/YER057c/UK114 family)